jgi:hypothetical protein
VKAPDFVASLLGYRSTKDGAATRSPNISDSSSDVSVRVSRALMQMTGASRVVPPKEATGDRFEVMMRDYLLRMLIEAAPERDWTVSKEKINAFEQYRHLGVIDKAVKENATLALEIGRDYLVDPDACVSFPFPLAGGATRFLHAAVSCKWTLRSDRAQNVRHEAVIMVRHRRGRLPHIAAVTMEPLPKRIAALAVGTGEVDAVYHPAYDELLEAVKSVGTKDQLAELNTMCSQKRLRPLADLVPTIAHV